MKRVTNLIYDKIGIKTYGNNQMTSERKIFLFQFPLFYFHLIEKKNF